MFTDFRLVTGEISTKLSLNKKDPHILRVLFYVIRKPAHKHNAFEQAGNYWFSSAESDVRNSGCFMSRKF